MPKTATREKPILFSAPMVRAILDGRKTQTRRIVTARNSTVNGYPGCQCWDHLHFNYNSNGYKTYPDGPNDTIFGCGPGVQYLHVPAWSPEDGELGLCSYRVRPTMEVGDVLWVREAWMPLWGSGAGFYTCLCPTGRKQTPDTIKYRADGEKPDNFGANWKPPIHMRREYSRISLEVTGVRVERVQSISEADAKAEGVPFNLMASTHRLGFENLWGSINGLDSWNKNPWVWVYEFRRIK